jgi:hypothetical protein
MPFRMKPSLSESLNPEQEAAWPIDAMSMAAPVLGAVRATAPKTALGNLWRMIVESGEGKPAADLTLRGLPGGPATVELLEGLGKRGLKESKGLATEAADFLKGRGYTGVKFSPMQDEQASAAARTRLFEYLLGRKAVPLSDLEQVIPFQ